MEDVDIQKEAEGPIIKDPQTLFDHFRKSTYYLEAFNLRQSKIKPTPEITEEQVKSAIEESDEIKEAFFRFTRGIEFQYHSESFPETSRKAIQDYEGTLRGYRDVFREMGLTTEENKKLIQFFDSERRKAHENAAFKIWYDKIAPSLRLSKALVSLIMIGKELDTYESATEADIFKAQRRVGLAL